MRYFEKNKRFVILKYLSPDFNSFTNIKIAEVKNMLCYVYDFDTIEEFNKIINSLYGRYIFFDQDNKKTFLYHKKSLIKPFKKIVLNDFKKVSKVDNSCLFEQIGGDKFSVCKKGNFVGVSDQFGRDVSSKFKKFLPDFRGSSIKSFIILGFFEEKKFFLFDVIFFEGRDISNEPFIYRRSFSSKIVYSGRIGRTRLLNFEDLKSFSGLCMIKKDSFFQFGKERRVIK